jgi:hypothetical protein
VVVVRIRTSGGEWKKCDDGQCPAAATLEKAAAAVWRRHDTTKESTT